MSDKHRSNMPVKGVEVYKSDMVVVRHTQPKGEIKPVKRGGIKEFSAQSRRRLAFVASNTSVEFMSMVTLTYPSEYPGDGWMVKDDLRMFMNAMDLKLGKFEYLWFMEFQKRGAPHIHILTDINLFHVKQWEHMRQWIAERWFNVVNSGDDRHKRAGTRFEKLRSSDGGSRYAVKYAKKMRQKDVPPSFRNVGRFYGYSQGVKPKIVGFYPISGYDLMKILNDWPYSPESESDLYKVLFNTSGTYSPQVILASSIQQDIVLQDEEHISYLDYDEFWSTI